MPDATEANTPPLAARVRDAEPERAPGKTFPGAATHEEGGASGPRFRVEIVRHGSRLLDLDNLAGGCKALIDALRYEGLIRADDPSAIDLAFSQVKVKRADIGTEVIITQL